MPQPTFPDLTTEASSETAVTKSQNAPRELGYQTQLYKNPNKCNRNKIVTIDGMALSISLYTMYLQAVLKPQVLTVVAKRSYMVVLFH